MQHVDGNERETVIVNALRILAHTQQVDPDFMRACIEKAGAPTDAGFGALLEQDGREFEALLQHVVGCKSVLEIGSRYGESLKHFAAMVVPRGRIVAVDLPYAAGCTGSLPDPKPMLVESIGEIAKAGHEAHLFIGDSHSEEVIEKVRALGPFDFGFIDGDHTYAGAKADWENYGPMVRKVVAFHDIVNNADCARLWREIKTAGYRTVEYTSSCWLGIGVVIKED